MDSWAHEMRRHADFSSILQFMCCFAHDLLENDTAGWNSRLSLILSCEDNVAQITLYFESYVFVSKNFICLQFIMVFPPLQFFFVKWSALYCLFSYHLFICEVCVDQETGTIFSHHQKTVIVDADAGNYRRKIIAFVGGLDLCGGRYDTPWHPLFRTLQTVHKEDYYNPNFAVSLVYVQCLMYWYLEFF